MEKLIRNPFVVVPLIILTLSSVLYFTFKTRENGDKQKQSPLAEHILIEDQMRVIITPLTYLPKSSPSFKIQMECYQYPEQTRLDLRDTALLQTNTGKPLLPTDWDIQKQDDYLTVGILSFPVTSIDYSRIKLTIFGSSEMVFEWNLPHSLNSK